MEKQFFYLNPILISSECSVQSIDSSVLIKVSILEESQSFSKAIPGTATISSTLRLTSFKTLFFNQLVKVGATLSWFFSWHCTAFFWRTRKNLKFNFKLLKVQCCHDFRAFRVHLNLQLQRNTKWQWKASWLNISKLLMI